MCADRHFTAFGIGIGNDGLIGLNTNTHVIEHSCQFCDISHWYFTTPFNCRIYLKVGWNPFGRSHSNTIEINYAGLQPTEFSLRTTNPFSAPIVYDITGNVILNDERLWYSARTMTYGSRVAVLAPNRIILFQFFNAMV